jgi:COP9 signalosome complex subunit 1
MQQHQPVPESGAAAEVCVVENATLDLEAYAAQYTGRTLARRLQFIALRCPALKIEALKMLVTELVATGMQPKLHLAAAQELGEACLLAGKEPPLVPTEAQVKELLVRSGETLDKLEAEHKRNRVFMVKETIRLGFTDLGDHLYAVGDLPAALKQYTRCRDYSTAANHVTAMCFNIVKVAIEMDNWVLVQSYISKAESSLESNANQTLAAKAHCCSGLALMANLDYDRAARCFLQVKFDHASEFPELMTARDVGVYGGLTALATFERKKIKELVIENASFKEFLELVPQVRELIKAFYTSKYSQCLAILDKLKPDFLLDIFLQPHINYLYSRIRELALVQYFSPFRSVDMHTMAAAFSCSVGELEIELIALIISGQVQGRIDSDKKILYARTVDQRTKTFADALEVGKMYRVHSKALLLRVAMTKANLSIRTKNNRRDGGGGGGMDDGFSGMGGPRSAFGF